MRKFLSVPLLLAVVALMAGCEDREPTTLTEPSFAKVEACSTLSDGQNALVGEIEEGIDDLFADRKSARGANQILDNIQRKLCNDQYADATSMAEDFAYLVYRQLPDKLTGPDPEAAAVLLVNMVFELASDPNATPFEIPDGAFEPTGGWGVIDPTSGGTVPCGNGECAVVIDPDAFGGTSPVTIAIERIPDGDVGAPDGPIPGFQGFPQGYEVVSSRQLLPDGPGALMALCVVDWYGSPPERAIGHLMDGGVELLVPVPVDGAVDCANAGDYAGTPLLAEAPGWLQSAARFAGKLARKALGVEPLYARYFAGTGLGGRPGSFTPFVPVAPTIMVGQTVQLTLVNGFEITWASDNGAVATVDGTGLVTGVSAGTATITASWMDDLGVPHEAWIEVTVEGAPADYELSGDVSGNGGIMVSLDQIDWTGLVEAHCYPDGSCTSAIQYLAYPPGTLVYLRAVPDAGWEWASWDGCDTEFRQNCSVTMDADRSVSVTFVEQTVSLSGMAIGQGEITATAGGVTQVLSTGTCAPDPLGGFSCTYSGGPIDYAPGTIVTLEGIPGTGWTYIPGSWVGCDIQDGTTCQVTMSSDKTVSFTFELPA